MITNYKPAERNTHTVRITFNSEGYTGHISYKVGGNLKGLDIIENAVSFIETCDEDDIERLVENDCQFEIDFDDETDEATFGIVLTKGEDNSKFIDILEDDIRNMIVAVEIADVKSETD
jgi:hypothetical protein